MTEKMKSTKPFDTYCLSKAIIHKLTELHAAQTPNLMISASNPGYCKTKLTNGRGERTPE